jgi:hypothetical protein
MNRVGQVFTVFLVLSLPMVAASHGIWGHVHVTGWAVENLPDGQVRDFFDDPEVMNALLFGAAFTDSGYWPQGGELGARSRAYSEHTHWSPFIQSFIEWVVVNDPPPWDTLESRQRVAFLMGCAAHGLQDEIFDSLFLFQVQEHDGAGQDEADPGTDGFLALDGHIRFLPTSSYLPYDVLVQLYAGLDEEVDASIIEESVGIMEYLYLNHELGLDIAMRLGEQYDDVIPWARAHYLDVDVPGSLAAEIEPTGRYLEALWGRLHGAPAGDNAVIFAYPARPRRLYGHRADSPASWVTFIFGAGVSYDGAATTWTARDGGDIAFAQHNTRWGGAWPRLVRMAPSEDLTPGGWYTTGLVPGVALIDGSNAAEFSLEFQVACTDREGQCEDLGQLPAPDLSGPGGGMADAGVDSSMDAGDPTEEVGAGSPGSSPSPRGSGCSQGNGQPLVSFFLRR